MLMSWELLLIAFLVGWGVNMTFGASSDGRDKEKT